MTEAKGKQPHCPKCDAVSGDDWSQCSGVCPMRGSPHFSEVSDTFFAEALEPCPFCGGEAEWREFDERHPYDAFGLLVNHAIDCFLNFPQSDDAIRVAWNRRTPKPADSRYGRVHTDGSRSGGQPPKADSQLVGVVAKAICRQPGSLCVGFCHSKRCAKAVELHGEDARAAIAALQPHLSADAERGRIVAWLRGIRMPEDDWTAEYIADLIERGAHREAGE